MNLCICCQNAKISHCSLITKTFLSTLSWSCTLEKDILLISSNNKLFSLGLSLPTVHLIIPHKLWYEPTLLLLIFFL